MSNYALFGKPFKGFKQDDSVDACMPDRFLDAPWNYNLGGCKQLMAQRCSENWDDKCQLYVNNIDDVTVLKQFLESMANHRFCNLSDKSKCAVVCEPFNPIHQSSPSICNTMGVDPMINMSQILDTGMYNPVKLSPVYMGGCMKKCDKINTEDIKNDDTSINYCLQFGFCGETLGNICKVMEENGNKSQNNLLNQYCSLKNKKTQMHKSYEQTGTSHVKQMTGDKPITDIKENDNSYSNNIGIFSVLLIVVLLSLFVINSKN